MPNLFPGRLFVLVGLAAGVTACNGAVPSTDQASHSALGATRTVNAGEDLQAVLNQAQGGDTIGLAANVRFTGHFRLPVNASGQVITLASSAMNALPGAGQRVSPSNADSMPKLVTPDANPVLVFPSGANGYRIQGLELTVAAGVYVQDLIQVGTASETSVAQLPHDIDFDRVYVHGDNVSGGKRGIALNGGNTTVENSYFEDFTSTNQDTQAMAGWNGSGPFLIQNNHLEAGTEIVAFGGAVPAIQGLVPSDITIQNNEFYKPTRYYEGSADYAGIKVWAKNHIEFKNGKNAVIQNNTFTNNFRQADQLGFVILLNTRVEGGAVPWATVSNITVKNNLFQHIGGGYFIMGQDGPGNGSGGNITLSGNTYVDVGAFGGEGRMYEVLNGVQGLTIDHETAFAPGFLFDLGGGPSNNVNVTNCIFTNGGGFVGDGTGPGEATYSTFSPNGIFKNNVIIGGNPSQYSGGHFANNFFPATINDVGFTNFSGGDYSLSSGSLYRGKATDNKDIGAVQTNSAPVPTSGLPTGWVTIVSKNSGKCLDVPAWSGTNEGLAPGAQLQQWQCWNGDMQQFQFVPVQGGYQVVNRRSGLSLDVGGVSQADGAPLVQWTYWGGDNQKYQVNRTSDGYYTLNPVHSGKCVDVSDVSKSDGAPVQQWTCWGGDNQKWSLIPVP